MATGHPTDEHGRILPDSSWPPERTAPQPLELVRRFCNTTNRENGADRLATVAGLHEWLTTQDRAPFHADTTDLASLIALREAFHDLTVVNAGHHEAPSRKSANGVIVGLLEETRFRIALNGPDLVVRPPDGDGGAQLMGDLVLTVVQAQAEGTWERLKACKACEWVVYDGSKNRSARWCSMRACGGRHKVRNYRARQAT